MVWLLRSNMGIIERGLEAGFLEVDINGGQFPASYDVTDHLYVYIDFFGAGKRG